MQRITREYGAYYDTAPGFSIINGFLGCETSGKTLPLSEAELRHVLHQNRPALLYSRRLATPGKDLSTSRTHDRAD